MAVVINAKGTSAPTFRIGKSGNYLGTNGTGGLFISTNGNINNLATIKVARPIGSTDATNQQYVIDQIALGTNLISQLDTNITITDIGLGSISHVVDNIAQYTITNGLFDLSPNVQLSAGIGTTLRPAIAFEGIGTGDKAGLWFDLAGGPQVQNQLALTVDGTTLQKWRVANTATTPAALEYEMSNSEAIIAATGTSTDINIRIIPKGLGQTLFGSGGTQSSISSGDSTTSGINAEDFLLGGGSAFDSAISPSTGGNIILTPGLGNALAGGGANGITIIKDANNQIVAEFNGVVSSVNYFIVTNSATTNNIKLSAGGLDTNVNIELIPKGSGLITAPLGYDMSNGQPESVVTKKYVDNMQFQTQNKSISYTTTLNDDVIFVNSSTSIITITLGLLTVLAGKQIIIKDSGGTASTNNITISTQGTETIDGQTTKIIINNYESVTLMSDGINWFMV